MGVQKPKSQNKNHKESSGKTKKVVLNVLLVISILVFVTSAYQIISYHVANKRSREKIEELIACTTITVTPTPAVTEKVQPSVQPTVTPTHIKDEEKDSILPEYQTLYDRNQDMIGWINIEGTQVNYPVMQTKEDGWYYLKRDFDRQDDVHGLPFLDAACDINAKGTNRIIYGHHMKDGSMFAALLDYEEESFYKEHQEIQFDTIYEKQSYDIIAVFQSRIAYQGEDVFRYYRYIDFESEEQFNDYLKQIKALSYYDTGNTAVYGDDLITLSTCDRRIKDGRFVVVARKRESH